jgi:3-deoxy-D-manno-octulosonate 8-phosphate phosphatase (KDO 8-P phosphatase)
MSFSNRIYNQAKEIRCLICDVDGVLTEGQVYLDNEVGEQKAFNIKDGLGIKMLEKHGIIVAIITGRKSDIVSRRMKELAVEHVYQGQADKQAAFDDLLAKLSLQPQQVAYVGDDLPDLPLMRRCAIGFAPADAAQFVIEKADYTLTKNGGRGAVREVAELLLQAQGKLDDIHQEYWHR